LAIVLDGVHASVLVLKLPADDVMSPMRHSTHDLSTGILSNLHCFGNKAPQHTLR